MSVSETAGQGTTKLCNRMLGCALGYLHVGLCRDANGVHVVPPAAPTFDLIAHLHRQREFSERTFGPGTRTEGVIDHITKELAEVRKSPHDLSEWIDLVLLSLDGAWRHGHSPLAIAQALAAKQAKNEARTWPDWRTVPEGKAIEHDRSAELIDDDMKHGRNDRPQVSK